MDPLSTAHYGMMSAQGRVAKSAERVAGWPADADVDLAAETVALIQARTEFAANARVAAFADETWRALLDVQAK
ncbi:flagellar hook protein FlgE [Phenylobacterium sp. LjRoot219]|uniref:flagellar hook protein FlgE n=1 Tax=Phenylobacterium sp. LjRoot219 TaxID=3342283 RepID=UPI003ECF8153